MEPRTRRIAVVRVRGRVGVDQKIEDTLHMLRLKRVNHCVVIDDRPSYMGMIRKVINYITWGYISKETFAELLRKRGEVEGYGRLDDEYVRKHTKYSSIDEFADAFMRFEAELDDIPGLKKVFRLHPPRKGWKSIKKPYKEGGALGFRDNMDELLRRMM